MSTNNPWLALSTYEEKDEKSFYGREQDANNLFSMLQQNEIVICYAASGDGKSSLINAGLCPKLRRDDMFPVRILFTSEEYSRYEIDFDKILNERIIQSLRDYEKVIDAKTKELGITRDGDFEFIDVGTSEYSNHSDYLWWKLRTQVINNPFNGKKLVPVLIFDQFEEIFHASWKAQFFLWLERMLSDVCPDEIINELDGRMDNLPNRKLFKMLFSMRYEYVGELDYWCSQRNFIPLMMRNRYFLKPLKTEDAISIIKCNKGTDNDQFSARLSDKAQIIVSSIKENSKDNNTISDSDSDEVSAIALSLVCYVLYERMSNDPSFSLDDKGVLEKIINSSIYDYYDDQLNALQIPNHVRDVLEEVLSPNNDRPRIPITFPKLKESHIDRYIYGKKDNEGNEMPTLVSTHILKKETIDGVDYIEFIHDRLVYAIAEHKDEIAKKAVERRAHYEEAIRSLPSKELYFLFQNLIHEDGKRRQVNLDEIKSSIKSFVELTQGENRIFRLCSHDQVELLNDQVAEIVYEKRKDYTNRNRKIGVIGGIVLFVLSLLVSGMAIWRSELYYKADYERNKALLNQSRYIAEKVKEIASVDSRLACLLAVEVLPNDLNHPDRLYSEEAEWALREAVSYQNMTLRNYEKVSSVCYSPDGEFVASSSTDGRIIVWNLLGSIVKEFKSAASVRSISFGPNGKNLVASSWNLIEIWDMERDTLADRFEIAAGGWINNAIYSPRGKRVLTACDDCSVKIIDSLGTVISQMIGHSEKVNTCAFSPDGKTIISASNDHTIKTWDFKTGQLLRTFDGFKNHVHDISYNPNGKQFVSVSCDSHAIIWDVINGVIIKDIELDNAIMSVSYSPDGRYIAFASWNQVDIFDTEIKEIVNTIIDCEENWIENVEFDPNGKSLIYASGKQVRLIGMDDVIGQHQYLNGRIAFKHPDIKSASYNSSGKRIITASSTQGIKFWNAKTSKEIWRLDTNQDGPRTAVFNTQGNLVVYNDGNKAIVCDTMGKPLDTIVHGCKVDFVSFQPHENHDCIITITSQDSTIRWWSVEKKQFVDSIRGSLPYNYVCHSSNGKYSCYFNNNYFEYDSILKRYGKTDVYTLDSTAIHFECNNISNNTNYSSPAGRIALSPDEGHYLFATLNTCSIKEGWSCDCLMSIYLNISDISLLDKNKCINSVAYSPDGRLIIIAQDDGTLELFSSQGEFHGNLHGKSSVQSASFSPEGNHIMSVQEDGTVMIWDFPSLQDLIDQTRERFKDRPLTPEERRQYYLE